MRKTAFAVLLALLYCVSGAAQTPDEWQPPKGLPYGNEIGIRYGAQIQLGSGGRLSPDLQAFSIDYARYNYYNIGFRTGLNVFLDSDVFDYYSIPMQFTWRTGRMVSAWRRSRDEGYPNNDPYGNGYNGESKPDWGSAFLSTLFAILPSAFEVHTGFTPGMMFGPLSLPPYDGGFLVRHRFSCTFDIGARLIIPIWRFNLYGDFTYHCYITDNFGFRYGTSVRPAPIWAWASACRSTSDRSAGLPQSGCRVGAIRLPQPAAYRSRPASYH